MAAEVKNLDININAVNPGMVETRTFRNAHPDYNGPDLMMPQDIARVILFLASEDARCIKGSIIDASNGQHLK
jgi:NAD(P)-dependent dehydrogenase (short-subunit alcohol dehydrogenase family)